MSPKGEAARSKNKQREAARLGERETLDSPLMQMPPPPSPVDRRTIRLAVAALLILHASLLAWAAARSSVAYDEFAHLPAGVAYWKHGTLAIYNQSPPLLRWWGALPAVLAGAEAPDPARALGEPADTRFWAYGEAFLARNFDRYQTYFLLGRLGLIPLSCLGAWIAFRFAGELYRSPLAGVAACAMYCLCPTIAGQASVIGTDAGSAVAMLAAVWLWWRFCRRPTRLRALLVAIAVALAHLCKFYAVFLWPMMALMAGWFLIVSPRPARRTTSVRFSCGIIACVLATWLIINLAYGFTGTLKPVSSYSFDGPTFRRIARVVPGRTRLLLPTQFILGYDAAEAEVETGFPGYLLGEAYTGTKWDFYPIALACKLPLSMLALLTAAAISSLVSFIRRLRRTHFAPDREQICDAAPVLLAMMVFLAAFVLLAKLNIGIRYLLPAFPLAFVLAARLWTWKWTRVAGWVLLAVLLVENLSQAPRDLSFYNVAAGRGYPIVNDFDWGQSLIDLRDWMHDNDVSTISLAYHGRVDPRVYGIDYVPLDSRPGPLIAISGYFLTGVGRPMATPRGQSAFTAIPFNHELMDRTPVAVLGSILVYKRSDVAAAQFEWQEKNMPVKK